MKLLASRTQWTWVWVDSGRWWWTGRSGMLQFMGSQRVRHDWATELNWTERKKKRHLNLFPKLKETHHTEIKFMFTKGERAVRGWINREAGINIYTLLLLSRFSRVQLCAIPEMAAQQAPPSLGFSRQEHWSGLPFLSPMHESVKWKWSHSVVSNS